MLKTKRDVDKHVTGILGQIKNEDERNLRGFAFAKMYLLVKEYELAKRYLAGFLFLREASAPAHQLMGQIHEHGGHLEWAVQSYKRSLELDANQKDVVLKICDLYCKLPVDPERARYWADRAEKLAPQSEIVFRLRETLVSADGEPNTQELEDLITNEILVKPRDVSLRVKLLHLFLDTERVRDSYDYAVQVEAKRPFLHSLEWYYCLVDVFEAYLEEQGAEYTHALSRHLLSALDRLIYLSLEDGHDAKVENRQIRSLQSCGLASMTALQTFDQHLYKSWQLKEPAAGGWWSPFVEHMQGQLYFHMATVVLNRIKQDHGNLKEASRMGAALLLAAYSYKPPNLAASWYVNASGDDRNAFMAWHDQACFRLSQSGHVLIGMCHKDRSKWLGKVREQVCTPQSIEKIYQRVLSSHGPKHADPKSFFLSIGFADCLSREFPDRKTLQEYDAVTAAVAHVLRSDSLHHLVWLALQQYNVKDKVQPTYHFKVFQTLQFSVARLENAAPESLCLLDVEAFVYATVRCSAMALDEVQLGGTYISPDMPSFLPASIYERLCTPEQSDFWRAAYSLYANTATKNHGELRRTLQRGIEVIRCIGLHGMNVDLVVHLAETFADRASELKEQCDDDEAHSNEVSHLEARATLYWKVAITMLERLTNNMPIRFPNDCLFPNYGHDPAVDMAHSLVEAGRFYLACQAMNQGNHEAAIKAFEVLQSPFASYYQSLTFKKLASVEFDNKSRESITSEMRSRHVILLTRARDALYVTLDRIISDKRHPLNQVLPQEIEDVETRLSRIDPDTAQRHGFDVASEESLSTQYSEERVPSSPFLSHPPTSAAPPRPSGDCGGGSNGQPPTASKLHSPLHLKRCDLHPLQQQQHHHHHHHLAGERVRPSPERLDAQIRSLVSKQDQLFGTVIEQNRAFFEQLRQNRVAVEKLTSVLEEIQKWLPLFLRGRCRRADDRRRSSSGRNQAHMDEEEQQEGGADAYDSYYDDVDLEFEGVDAQERGSLEFQYNRAHVLPPDAMHGDYPYGPAAGIHGAYAPPPLAREGLTGQAGYSSYYATTAVLPPPGHLPQAPPLSMMPAGQHPLRAMPQPFFNPAAPTVFSGLPFSEGQKLPEFHFTVDASLGFSQSQDRGSVFTRLGLQPLAPTVGVPASQPSSSFNKSLSGVDPEVTDRASVAPSAVCTPASNIVLPPQAAVAMTIDLHPAPQSHILTDSKSPAVVTGAAAAVGAESPFATPPTGARHRKDTDDSSSSSCVEKSVVASPDFKPAIPLPAEVEVRTGEEDELVLFEERAKLFRYVGKEWKERGVGTLKVLHNQAVGRVRVLMRRDQILKTCANHYILPSMALSPMKNVEKAWLWAAQDFADGEIRVEQFCARFKTSEAWQKFADTFERAKGLAARSGEEDSATKPSAAGFGKQFAPKEGSWECPACLLRNDAERRSCVACEAPCLSSAPKSDGKLMRTPAADGQTPVQIKFGASPQTSTPFSGFGAAFGAGTTNDAASPAFKFGFSSATSSSGGGAVGLVFGNACMADAQVRPSGFVFGASPVRPDGGLMGPASSLLSSLANKQKLEMEADSGGQWPVPDSTTPTIATSADETKPKVVPLTPPKFTHGGFSFTSAPVIKPYDENDDAKEKGAADKKDKASPVKPAETAKPNPFAKFSFSLAPGASPDDKRSGVGGELKPVFGTVFSQVDDLSFSSPAESESAGRDAKLVGFGVGKVPASPDAGGVCAGGRQDEFEPTAEFQPVIPLPELVSVTTGEEDEEKLFGERAKLFRFVAATKEWKERGVGEIKLLRHAATRRVRILMRREQVLKVCANHHVTAQMALLPMLSSDRAWTWVANDYADGEVREEKLAVRFKNADRALAFKEAFEAAQEKLAEADAVSPHPDATAASSDGKEEERSLSERFGPKTGSWECPTCCIRSERNVDVCPACQTGRPAAAAASEARSDGVASKQQQPLNELFRPPLESWECPLCYVRNGKECAACQACKATRPGAVAAATQPAIKFGFGSSAAPNGGGVVVDEGQTLPVPRGILRNMLADCSASDEPKTPPSTTTFGFGSLAGDAKKTDVDFRFGSPQTFQFSFDGVQARSPTKVKSPVAAAAAADDGGGAEGDADSDTGEAESEGEGIYFHPVIPLPDKVEVVTGEEDEEVLYCQRAKLYRLADGEWKERGLGNFKILRHATTGKIRLLMRREHILKVCCNHYLTPELVFRPKDERSLAWYAGDFSDGDAIRHEHLAVRFKSADVVRQFRLIVDEAQERLRRAQTLKNFLFKLEQQRPGEQQQQQSPSTSPFTFGERFTNLGSVSPLGSIFGGAATASPLSPPKAFGSPSLSAPAMAGASAKADGPEVADDIAVVYQKTCSVDQNLKAARLQLPHNFYLYEDKPPCAGCRGCEGGGGDDDVQVSWEARPTDEQVRRALDLQLPATFFLYEDKPPCPGCRGCEDYDASAQPPRAARGQPSPPPPSETIPAELAPQEPVSEAADGDDSEPAFFANSKVASMSFSSIAQEQKDAGFFAVASAAAANDEFHFSGSGAPVFTASARKGQDDSDEEEEEEEGGGRSADQGPHFEPVIPLPKLIDVKTGEEDEDKVFCQRGKLYRFDQPTKQWKERGVGEMKILKHRETGRFRLLMRREQIHKIACNHALTVDMTLSPLQTSESAFCWIATDFAEETPKLENFALRFKNAQLAQEFRAAFEKCQQELMASRD